MDVEQTDISEVVQELEGYYTPRRIEAWLQSPNAHLGGRAPLYMIRHGQVAAVLEAIRAMKAGSYA